MSPVGRFRWFVGNPGSACSGSVTQLSGEWYSASVGVRRPQPIDADSPYPVLWRRPAYRDRRF